MASVISWHFMLFLSTSGLLGVTDEFEPNLINYKEKKSNNFCRNMPNDVGAKEWACHLQQHVCGGESRVCFLFAEAQPSNRTDGGWEAGVCATKPHVPAKICATKFTLRASDQPLIILTCSWWKPIKLIQHSQRPFPPPSVLVSQQDKICVNLLKWVLECILMTL